MEKKERRKSRYYLPEIAETVDKESEFYKRNVLPVDHGWAWVICFAGFIVYFVFGVSTQVLVVLFIEIIEHYNVTITVGSLMFMCSVFAVGIMSVISTQILAPYFGEKFVVCTAGLCSMIFTMGMSFAPNFGIFLLCGVFKGMATGAVFVPSISLIRLYFCSRRSIAQIMANMGQSIGGIIAPPLVRIVRNHFGISGTFVIMAGIELHITFAGLLLRPVSAYKFRPTVTESNTKMTAVMAAMINEDYQELRMKEAQVRKLRRHIVVMTAVPFQRLSLKNQNTLGPVSQDITQSTKDISKFSDVYKNDLRNAISNQRLSRQGSTISINAIPAAQLTSRQVKQLQNDRYWLLRMILVSAVPGSSSMYIRNYVPAITIDRGANLDHSALLLTIVGSVDILSRLCMGMFADLHILSYVQIIIISQLCLAVVCHCLEFFYSYEMLKIYCILLGVFIGTRTSLTPLVALEIVGIEDMPKALSVISTVGALSYASMNPILGYVAENEGFVMVMHVLGVCFTVSSTIMLIVPLIVDIYNNYKNKNDDGRSSQGSIRSSLKLDAGIKLRAFFGTKKRTGSNLEDGEITESFSSLSLDSAKVRIYGHSVDPKNRYIKFGHTIGTSSRNSVASKKSGDKNKRSVDIK